MTETGMSLGTPHYMSPEQATAEKDLTNRSDIYSLGCVLYEMLTGEPPHTGSSAMAVVMKIVTDEAWPVTEGIDRGPAPNASSTAFRAPLPMAPRRCRSRQSTRSEEASWRAFGRTTSGSSSYKYSHSRSASRGGRSGTRIEPPSASVGSSLAPAR